MCCCCLASSSVKLTAGEFPTNTTIHSPRPSQSMTEQNHRKHGLLLLLEPLRRFSLLLFNPHPLNLCIHLRRPIPRNRSIPPRGQFRKHGRSENRQSQSSHSRKSPISPRDSHPGSPQPEFPRRAAVGLGERRRWHYAGGVVDCHEDGFELQNVDSVSRYGGDGTGIAGGYLEFHCSDGIWTCVGGERASWDEESIAPSSRWASFGILGGGGRVYFFVLVVGGRSEVGVPLLGVHFERREKEMSQFVQERNPPVRASRSSPPPPPSALMIVFFLMSGIDMKQNSQNRESNRRYTLLYLSSPVTCMCVPRGNRKIKLRT